MNHLKKWLITADLATLIIGSVMMYFAEDVVRFFWPTEAMPSSVIALLYYVTIFSIAAFWIFNGISYATIKIFWHFIYDYFEEEIKTHFKLLKAWQKVVVSLSLYLGLFFLLVLTFSAAVAIFH
jgi:hypothetical protein